MAVGDSELRSSRAYILSADECATTVRELDALRRGGRRAARAARFVSLRAPAYLDSVGAGGRGTHRARARTGNAVLLEQFLGC